MEVNNVDDLRIIELYFECDEQPIKETDKKYGKLCHNIAYLIISLIVGAEGKILGTDAVLGAECAVEVCVITKSALLIDLSRRMP